MLDIIGADLFQPTRRRVSGKEIIVLLAIFLAGLALRVFCWRNSGAISRDAATYLDIAERLAECDNVGDFFFREDVLSSPPLFVWLISCGVRLGLSSELVGLWLNLLSGAMFPLVVWAMFRFANCKSEIAFSGAVLTALHPSLVGLSIEIQRDMPYLFCIGLALLFLQMGCNDFRKFHLWMSAGVCCGVSAMIRVESLELLFIVPFVLSVATCFRHDELRRSFYCMGIFVAATVLTVVLFCGCFHLNSRYCDMYREKIGQSIKHAF